jgi:hypothetical protein
LNKLAILSHFPGMDIYRINIESSGEIMYYFVANFEKGPKNQEDSIRMDIFF